MTNTGKSLSETLEGLNKEIDKIRTQNEPSQFLKKEVKGSHISYSYVSYEKIYEKFPDIPVTIWDLHNKKKEITNLAEWTEWRKQLDYMMKNFLSRLNDWYDCEHFMAWVVRRVKNCIEVDLIQAYEAYLESGLSEIECVLWEYVSKQTENTEILDKYFKLFQREKRIIIKVEMKNIKEFFWLETDKTPQTTSTFSQKVLRLVGLWDKRPKDNKMEALKQAASEAKSIIDRN